ncbi:MAG: hypothetical protein IBX64_08040, partial [Actinobacteria bacterium]|nr:hypothetical protein [Actinomycetota bacterium]
MAHLSWLYRKLLYGKKIRLALFFGMAFLLLFFAGTANAFAGTLTVTNISPPSLSTEQGTVVAGEILQLHASPENTITVTGMKVIISGARDSDLNLVKLVKDVNGNNSFDNGVDQILASTTTAGGVAEFSAPNIISIAANTTETIFVVFEISNSATVGATIQSSLPDQSYITVSDTDVVAPFSNYYGTVITIEDKPDTLLVSQLAPPT